MGGRRWRWKRVCDKLRWGKLRRPQRPSGLPFGQRQFARALREFLGHRGRFRSDRLLGRRTKLGRASANRSPLPSGSAPGEAAGGQTRARLLQPHLPPLLNSPNMVSTTYKVDTSMNVTKPLPYPSALHGKFQANLDRSQQRSARLGRRHAPGQWRHAVALQDVRRALKPSPPQASIKH